MKRSCPAVTSRSLRGTLISAGGRSMTCRQWSVAETAGAPEQEAPPTTLQRVGRLFGFSCISPPEPPLWSLQDPCPSGTQSERELEAASFVRGPSHLRYQSSVLRQELDVEEFVDAQHSMIPCDPVPEELLELHLAWHPAAAFDEWQLNLRCPHYYNFYWTVGTSLRYTPSALPEPDVPRRRRHEYWGAKRDCGPCHPPKHLQQLDLAQMAACMLYTRWQELEGWPMEEWLLEPSPKFWAMWRAKQSREEGAAADISMGWRLRLEDLVEAGGVDNRPRPMEELVEEYSATCGYPDVLAGPLFPARPDQEEVQLWRRQMEEVRFSVLGDKALRVQKPPPLQQTLWQKLRTLVVGQQPAGKRHPWDYPELV